MEYRLGTRELEQAAYLKGLRVASEIAQDHSEEFLRGYVVGFAAGTNAERQGDDDGRRDQKSE